MTKVEGARIMEPDDSAAFYRLFNCPYIEHAISRLPAPD